MLRRAPTNDENARRNLLPLERLRRNWELGGFVILNEVKNLIISNELIAEILRQRLRITITTQPPEGEGKGEGGLRLG